MTGPDVVAPHVTLRVPSSAAALRSEMPMNIKFSGGGAGYAKPYPPALASNLARVNEIFEKTRERFGASGPFLFGSFCAADAMFAPVCMRLRSYVVEVGGERHQEMRRLPTTLRLPARSLSTAPFGRGPRVCRNHPRRCSRRRVGCSS